MHFLKLSFAKRLRGRIGASSSFWQKRYYDRNVRDEREFKVKLRYLHRNPVKRGLVKDPADWKWSSYRHSALREVGPVEIKSDWTAVDRETGGPSRYFLSQVPDPRLASKERTRTWGTWRVERGGMFHPDSKIRRLASMVNNRRR